jgi:hypothetical protein
MLEGPFARGKCRGKCVLRSRQVLTQCSEEGDVILTLLGI